MYGRAGLGGSRSRFDGWLRVACVAFQIVLFGAMFYANRDRLLSGDATFYDSPAWNLASGNGMSIARDEWEDPHFTSAYHSRHPEEAGNRYVPVAVFPPGYTLFMAGIYSVFGRSHAAVVIANGVVLLAALGLVFVLIQRALGRSLAATFAVLAVGTYPFFAYWSAMVMNDVLHVALVLGWAVAWFHPQRSARRIVVAGMLLGAAILVRPYTLLLPVALGAYAMIYSRASIRQIAMLALLAWIPMGAWVARNYAHFGTPMVTSMGPGLTLWISSQEYMDSYELPTDTELWQRLDAMGIRNVHARGTSDQLTEIALQRISDRPLQFMFSTVLGLPRLWLSQGYGTPLGVRILLGVYGWTLLGLTIVGGVIAWRRRNSILRESVVVVLYYTLVFAPMHIEGRYTLPARPFALLLAGLGAAYLVRRYVDGAVYDRVRVRFQRAKEVAAV